MKKLFVLLMVLGLGLPGLALADDYGATLVTVMGGSTAISASHCYSSTSTIYNVGNRQGYFSVQASATGNGTASINYQISLDGTNFATPATTSAAITGLTSSSGTVTAYFAPPLCQKIKVIVTETGGSNTITPTIYLMYR